MKKISADAKSTCLYCHNEVEKIFRINKKSSRELICCSETCQTKAKNYMEYIHSKRVIFYLAGFVILAANLIMLNAGIKKWWSFLPLSGLGILWYFYPFVFVHMDSYYRFGIEKTDRIIKKIALIIILISVLFAFVYFNVFP